MSTPNLIALNKTSNAISEIKEKLQLVIEKLHDNGFDKHTAQAQATLALSIGMLKYMGARLQGKDQGRNSDDPLRKELNKMKQILAQVKKKTAAAAAIAEEKKNLKLQTIPNSKNTSAKRKIKSSNSDHKRKSKNSNSDHSNSDHSNSSNKKAKIIPN